MTDFKNSEAEEKSYPKLMILRDGLGILVFSIIFYLLAIMLWS